MNKVFYFTVVILNLVFTQSYFNNIHFFKNIVNSKSSLYANKYNKHNKSNKNLELNTKRNYQYEIDQDNNEKKKYPLSQKYYENYIKKLNSKNNTLRDQTMLNEDYAFFENIANNTQNGNVTIYISKRPPFVRIMNPNDGTFNPNNNPFNPFNHISNDDNGDDDDTFDNFKKKSNLKSKNFEVIKKSEISFKNIGGYANIKSELLQCVDLLSNYTKYNKYNVRVPKGIILEGPPGNGKTLLAKAFATEAGVGFIPVSGSEFQEKYVGVGAARIRELFDLAQQNIPCIIFIDEIDAVGRKRSGDGEQSASERDSTLNELLVKLDGFKSNAGIFLIGATNRIDLLDPALIRPGRIDKKIYIGMPDSATRKSILQIHLNGKPHDQSINITDLVDMTMGLSGAQIENVLNEAMLNSLRDNREIISINDIDTILNKVIAGWQPSEHQFTNNIIDHISIHEMGHAIVGLLSKHHSKLSKVIINLSSPKSPGYTLFEGSTSTIYTRESLFEHLMILLAGRIAEEEFFDVSVTTGAINDFEEALKLAEKMIVYYGMGSNPIYPHQSEKYKEVIDNEVTNLIKSAYTASKHIISLCHDLIYESSEILKSKKILNVDELILLIKNKYPKIYNDLL